MATKIEIYDGETLLQEELNPTFTIVNGKEQYQFPATNVPIKAIALTAKRYEDGVLVATSPVVNVTGDAAGSGATPYEFFGLRKHNSNYTGAAIQVQRDSDDVLFEIGFDANGDLDTAALTNNLGSGRGYVKRVYGQYNANVFEQITKTKMPMVYDAGAVETRNGKPTIRFGGTGVQLLAPAANFTAENGLTAFIPVNNFETSGSNRGIFGKWGTTAEYAALMRHFGSPNDFSMTGKNSSDVSTALQSGVVANTAATRLLTYTWGTTDQHIRINGVEQARNAITGVRSGTNKLVWGGYEEGSLFTESNMRTPELMIYKSVVDPSADESAINTYYTIY